ncbi:unnamed protein product [Ectocarpus sp. CCAP 1310/34]|nr:unnamed protein product [Ectocarpus sp. CCAP 1310/34]
MSNVHVEEDVSSEEEGDHGRPIVHKFTISEGEVRSRLEDVRSYLTHMEETASTAKRRTFFRRLCIRLIMNLRSSEEQRRGGRCGSEILGKIFTGRTTPKR